MENLMIYINLDALALRETKQKERRVLWKLPWLLVVQGGALQLEEVAVLVKEKGDQSKADVGQTMGWKVEVGACKCVRP